MDATRYTPGQLADILEAVALGASTGALALLDEITAKWSAVHPELDAVQQEFAAARCYYWPSPWRDTSGEWVRVVCAADALADRLRPYGGEHLPES